MDSQLSPFLKPLSLSVSLPDSIKYSAILGYMMALIIPWLTSIPAIMVILIDIVVLACGLRFLFFNQYTKTLAEINSIILNEANQWQVILKDGHAEDAAMGKNHYVHHMITILHLRWRHANWYFLFTKENIPANACRYLRVRLLHPVTTTNSKT